MGQKVSRKGMKASFFNLSQPAGRQGPVRWRLAKKENIETVCPVWEEPGEQSQGSSQVTVRSGADYDGGEPELDTLYPLMEADKQERVERAQ